MTEWLGVARVAERYGVHTNTVQRWCREGRFPNAKRESGVWLIPASDLENFKRPRPGPEPRRKEEVEDVMDERARDACLRRKAERQGLTLRKSRVRTINIDNHGGYMLLDTQANTVVRGERWQLTLDDVESYLTPD